MPSPVLLGLPWLAAFFSGLFDIAINWGLKYLGKKIAIVAAVIAAWGAAFAALKAATIGAVAAGAVGLPSEVMEMAGAIIPGNLGTFLSTIGATEFACSVYKVTARVISMKAAI